MIFKPINDGYTAITDRYIFVLSVTPNGKYNARAIGRGYYIGFYREIAQNVSFPHAVKACERLEQL